MLSIYEQEEQIFNEWRSADSKGFVSDGMVNEEDYSKPGQSKILFLLKEANSDESFDLREFVRKGGRRQTWDNITRWVMGIRELDREMPWSELKSITEADRKNYLSSIVSVNIKKKCGGNTANSYELSVCAEKDADMLREQLGLYHPDIIICCGTGWLYKDFIYKDELRTELWKETSRGIPYLYHHGCLVVDFAHPMARIDSCFLYYMLIDALIEILRTNSPTI